MAGVVGKRHVGARCAASANASILEELRCWAAVAGAPTSYGVKYGQRMVMGAISEAVVGMWQALDYTLFFFTFKTLKTFLLYILVLSVP